MERLLYSNLPKNIVAKLRKNPSYKVSEFYENVTVCFIGIYGIETVARDYGHRVAVNVLNRIFTDVDICIKEQLEGVWTVEHVLSEYMFVTGVPLKRSDHARSAVDAAVLLSEIVDRSLRRIRVDLMSRCDDYFINVPKPSTPSSTSSINPIERISTITRTNSGSGRGLVGSLRNLGSSLRKINSANGKSRGGDGSTRSFAHHSTASSKRFELHFKAGINSGEVSAGVVGELTKKYGLFGDTINMAARMKSTADNGMIQISKATAMELERGPSSMTGSYSVSKRGFIDVKGKESAKHTSL